MDLKVELKLLRIISQFKDMALEKAKFREKTIDGKKFILLELGFYDANGDQSTMVLTLDKELTISDCENLYEGIIQ